MSQNDSKIDLEKYYKQFNFPASSTFVKQLKNEGIKITKKEIDDFLVSRAEQQQTTIQSNRKKLLGKIVAYRPISLIQMDIFDITIQEQIKDINIYYVLLTYSRVKYGLTRCN